MSLKKCHICKKRFPNASLNYQGKEILCDDCMDERFFCYHCDKLALMDEAEVFPPEIDPYQHLYCVDCFVKIVNKILFGDLNYIITQ